MEKFVCANCKYRFKAEKADTCPYCAKKTIEKDKSAAEILDEVANLLEE